MSIGIDFPIMAENLMAEKKYDEAVQLCREGVRAYPDYSLGRVMLAKALSYAGMDEEAEKEANLTSGSMGFSKSAKNFASGQIPVPEMIRTKEVQHIETPSSGVNGKEESEFFTGDSADDPIQSLTDTDTEVQTTNQKSEVSNELAETDNINELELMLADDLFTDEASCNSDESEQREHQDENLSDNLLEGEADSDPSEYDSAESNSQIEPSGVVNNDNGTIALERVFDYRNLSLIPGLDSYDNLKRRIDIGIQSDSNAADEEAFSGELNQDEVEISPALGGVEVLENNEGVDTELSANDDIELKDKIQANVADNLIHSGGIDAQWDELTSQLNETLTNEVSNENDSKENADAGAIVDPPDDAEGWDSLYEAMNTSITDSNELDTSDKKPENDIEENLGSTEFDESGLSEWDENLEVGSTEPDDDAESNPTNYSEAQTEPHIEPTDVSSETKSVDSDQESDIDSQKITKELVAAIKSADYSIDGIKDLMDNLSQDQSADLSFEEGGAIETTETLAKIFWDQEAYPEAIASYLILEKKYPDNGTDYRRNIRIMKKEAKEKGVVI